MTFLDHGLVFVIAFVYPVAGFIGFRRLLKRAAAGEAIVRSELYRNTMISHWTLFLMCTVLWAVMDRPWPALGFGLDVGLWFAVSAILVILGIVILVMQIRQVSSASAEEVDGIAKRFGNLSIIIPHNGSELARFYGLSVTAGIVEEVLA